MKAVSSILLLTLAVASASQILKQGEPKGVKEINGIKGFWQGYHYGFYGGNKPLSKMCLGESAEQQVSTIL